MFSYVFSDNIFKVNHFLINSLWTCLNSSIELGIISLLKYFANGTFDQRRYAVILYHLICVKPLYCF